MNAPEMLAARGRGSPKLPTHVRPSPARPAITKDTRVTGEAKPTPCSAAVAVPDSSPSASAMEASGQTAGMRPIRISITPSPTAAIRNALMDVLACRPRLARSGVRNARHHYGACRPRAPSSPTASAIPPSRRLPPALRAAADTHATSTSGDDVRDELVLE